MARVKLTFTQYKNKFDKHGLPIALTWDEWVANYFTTPAIRGTPDLVDADKKTLDDAKDGPALVLGEIPKGKSHKEENVVALHALALDIDGKTDEEAAHALMRLSDYHYAAYTTFKNGTALSGGKIRLRVIVPLAAPLSVADYKRQQIWQRFNQFVGGVNDEATKDPNRLHFLPATFDPQYFEAFQNEGRDFLALEELPFYTPTVVPPPAKAKSTRAPTDTEISDAVQRVRRRAMCASPKVEGDELAGALKALLRKDSLAGAGGRHATLRDLTWWLSKKERELSDEALEILFGPSIDVMQSEDPSWAGGNGMAEVLKLYRDAVEKRNSILVDSDPSFAPYTEEDLRRIAAAQSAASGSPVSVADLKRRWIIQHGNSFFFLQSNGYYSKPATGPYEGRTKMKQILKRAPVTLDEPSQNGVRKRAVTDVVEDFGWVADNLQVDLTAQGSYFDSNTSTLHEATCPQRVWKAEYDPEIARWFELLAGPEHHDLFLDWLSVFPDLTQNIAGLYIKGAKGAGKSLLCNGLARIWTTGGYTSMSSMFQAFNERAAMCPLVVADEQMPPTRRGEDPTAVLRQILGNKEHELNRKYRTTAAMHGSLRIVLTANNSELLRASHIAGPEDQAALTERILIIEATSAASKYLTSLGGLAYLDKRWREDDGIAKHVLWLYLERGEQVQIRGDRFAVAGRETATHRQAFTSNYGLLVREWLVKYCEAPTIVEQHPQLRALLQVGDGAFYVNSEVIKLGWNSYLGLNIREEPRIASIGRALAVMAPTGSPGRVQRIVGNKRVWFYEIDPLHLVEFAKEQMIGSEDSIIATVDRPLKVAV